MRGILGGIAATAAAVTFLPLAAGAQDHEIRLGSQVTGIEISRLDSLPGAPKRNADFEWCSHLSIKPATEAGKYVEDKGWIATGELKLGAFQVVSFVGNFEGGTSGTCKKLGGNIGIFSGSKLKTIVYAGRESPLSISQVSPLDSKSVRILDGDYLSMTVADIRLIGDTGIAITPPALEESVCNGAASVPFVERMPIDLARELVGESGWKPIDQTGIEEPESITAARLKDFFERGIIEVESCSGTGFGFCSFTYSGAAGSLSLTTVGEIGDDGSMPWVYGYGVQCGAKP